MAEKILIVDDEPDIVKFLKIRLESNGYDVISASDGESCLERALKDKPDLIILDIIMPGINGFEVCMRLKKDAQTRDIPVVMLTALARESDLSKGLEQGADCFISKPFNPVDLLDEINAALSGKNIKLNQRDTEAKMPKRKILLVDDEVDFLKIMGQRIESWGYQVISASSGRQALDALMDKSPNMVILDYRMEQMDGIETLREIRKIDEKIPVIMFTAYPEVKTIKATGKLKADILIPKFSEYSNTASTLKASIESLEKKLDKENRD